MAAAAAAAEAARQQQLQQQQQQQQPVFCLCRQPDDQVRAMIACEGGCEDWFHIDCLGLSEAAYDDIDDFICPNCERTTGRRTTRHSDAPGSALVTPALATPALATPISSDPPLTYSAGIDSGFLDPSLLDPSLDAGLAGPASDDPAPPPPAAPTPATVAPAVNGGFVSNGSLDVSAPSSEGVLPPPPRASDPEGELLVVEAEPSYPPKAYARAPPPLKSTSSSSSNKRSSVSAPSAKDKDAAKLLEKTREQCREGFVSVVKPLIGGGDEEKARAFARELEALVFAAEDGGSDKGRKKYLDRMRSLRFNVSKSDRKSLREGIQNGTITADALSRLSNAELANPALQDQIRAAQQEAIRERVVTAEMSAGPVLSNTHKGLSEFTDARVEAQRLEARERALGEEESRRRKREREWDESVEGMVERAQGATDGDAPAAGGVGGEASGQPEEKRRRSENGEPAQPVKPVLLSPQQLLDAAQPKLVPSPPSARAQRFSLDSVWADATVGGVGSTTPPGSPMHDGVPQLGGADDGENDALNEFLSFDAFDQPAANGAGEQSQKQQHHDERDMSPFREADGGFDFFQDEPAGEAQQQQHPAAPQSEASKTSVGLIPYAEDLKLDGEAGLSSLETIWHGEVSNPDDPHPGPLHARQVAGLAIPASFWPTLLPQPVLNIIGRVPVANSRKFLHQAQLSASKEVLVVLLEGADDTGRAAIEGIRQFLISRNRDALIQPYGSDALLPAGAARDMYLVVVRKDEEIPEFLDDIKSNKIPEEPSKRSKDLLLGVLIRQKKAAAAAAAPASSCAPAAPPVNPTPVAPVQQGHSPAPFVPPQVAPPVTQGTPYVVPYEYKPLGSAPIAPVPPATPDAPPNPTPPHNLFPAPSAAAAAPVVPNLAGLLASLQGTLSAAPPPAVPPAPAPGFTPPHAVVPTPVHAQSFTPPQTGSHSPYAAVRPPHDAPVPFGQHRHGGITPYGSSAGGGGYGAPSYPPQGHVPPGSHGNAPYGPPQHPPHYPPYQHQQHYPQQPQQYPQYGPSQGYGQNYAGRDEPPHVGFQQGRGSADYGRFDTGARGGGDVGGGGRGRDGGWGSRGRRGRGGY